MVDRVGSTRYRCVCIVGDGRDLLLDSAVEKLTEVRAQSMAARALEDLINGSC